MIDNKLLEVLVCPENHMRLSLADAALLERINKAVAAGGVVNIAGTPVESPLDAALVREDSQLFYPVIDDIPILLADEAIALEPFV